MQVWIQFLEELNLDLTLNPVLAALDSMGRLHVGQAHYIITHSTETGITLTYGPACPLLSRLVLAHTAIFNLAPLEGTSP